MRHRASIYFWYVLAWGGLSLHFTLGDYAAYPYSFWTLLRLNFLQELSWVFAGWLLFRLADRWPLRGFGDGWRITLHVGFLLVLAGLSVALAFWVQSLLMPTHGFRLRSFLSYWGRWYPTNFLVLAASAGVYHAYRVFQELRGRELRASVLETRVAEAQHRALRWQLQPHFLFNTLHSISALVHRDPDRADTMITRLGDFLRMTLDGDFPGTVTLRREVPFLQAYLAIEQVRFGDRLRVVWDLPEGLLDRRVPHLILQPLVENALVHGLGPISRPGTLTLRAREEGDQLVLEVQDDGVGMVQQDREGVGLQNIRARIALLYGGQGALHFHSIPGKGTLAHLSLPREAASCV